MLEIHRFDETESFNTPEGLIIPLFASKKISVMHIKIPAGLKVQPHSHKEDTILILIKGSIRLTGDEPINLMAGDLAYKSGDSLAGIECEEDSVAVVLTIPSSYENVEELCSALRSIFGSGGNAT